MIPECSENLQQFLPVKLTQRDAYKVQKLQTRHKQTRQTNMKNDYMIAAIKFRQSKLHNKVFTAPSPSNTTFTTTYMTQCYTVVSTIYQLHFLSITTRTQWCYWRTF